MEGLSDHILIVDDDEPLNLLYQIELREAGFRVSVAESAAEALDRIRQEKPDLIVLDIRMPGMDGLELMGRVLAMDPGIRIVLNSAYAAYKDSFSSWAADAYVVKSSDMQPLLGEIRRVLAVKDGAPAKAPVVNRRPVARAS